MDLPEAIDPDGDVVTITFQNGPASFIESSSQALTISDLSDEAVVAGSYNIDISLSDGKDSTSYTVQINVQPPFESDVLDALLDAPSEDLPEEQSEEQSETSQDESDEGA